MSSKIVACHTVSDDPDKTLVEFYNWMSNNMLSMSAYTKKTLRRPMKNGRPMLKK